MSFDFSNSPKNHYKLASITVGKELHIAYECSPVVKPVNPRDIWFMVLQHMNRKLKTFQGAKETNI